MKYMGSKNKLSKDIAPIIQSYITSNIKGYYEPFVGGCNMIDKIKHDKRFGSDNHKYLIALLQNLDKLELLDSGFITKEHYSEVRTCYNNGLSTFEDWYIGAIGFLASYNGRFFDGGYAGIVKTKINTERNYYKEALDNLIEQRNSLNGIIFKYLDYKESNNISNFVIYCDPPYKDTKQYSTSKGFNYDEYYDWCRKMSKNNIVLCSEYWMPDDFECIWSKGVQTTMDNNRIQDDSKYNRVEKLFKYGVDRLKLM